MPTAGTRTARPNRTGGIFDGEAAGATDPIPGSPRSRADHTVLGDQVRGRRGADGVAPDPTTKTAGSSTPSPAAKAR